MSFIFLYFPVCSRVTAPPASCAAAATPSGFYAFYQFSAASAALERHLAALSGTQRHQYLPSVTGTSREQTGSSYLRASSGASRAAAELRQRSCLPSSPAAPASPAEPGQPEPAQAWAVRTSRAFGLVAGRLAEQPGGPSGSSGF